MGDSRLCSAHSSQTGKRCKRPPIVGGTVCASHGGSAPQVREAARIRLLESVDPVTAELVRLALESPDLRVRLQACRDVLDRVGLRETTVPDDRLTPERVEAEIARLEAELGLR